MSELKPNRHRNPKLSNRVKKDEPTTEEMLELAKSMDKGKKPLYLNDKSKTIIITDKKNHNERYKRDYIDRMMNSKQ